jgi:hypothetical protein
MKVHHHLQHGFYIVLIYLLISGNYLNHLLGCKVHAILDNTLWLKHLLGFMTTYFLIILAVPPDTYGHRETLGFTVVIYVWFYLTTRMNATFWIPMITLATLAFFVYMYLGQRKIKDAFAFRGKVVQTWMIVAAAMLTIVGVLVHYGERKVVEGSRFRAWDFWTEQASRCSQVKEVDVPILKSLQAAFGL